MIVDAENCHERISFRASFKPNLNFTREQIVDGSYNFTIKIIEVTSDVTVDEVYYSTLESICAPGKHPSIFMKLVSSIPHKIFLKHIYVQ